MATEWTAEVEWLGGLLEGDGRILATTSGLVPELEITWTSRTDESEGKSSPEELLAAAHASDFAMQLAHGLVGAGWEPEEMQVSAKVSYESGIGITGVELTASVTTDGIPDELLRQVAERAKATCPISKALAGVEITLSLPDLPPPEEEEPPEDEYESVGEEPDEE
jgi:osmotically inducible protein OsmC